MRPLLLTLTAFGPFRDTQAVNFDALGRNSLFLVAGATGSGKTTLLDAICYALFGVASGERRLEKDLRCQSAESAIETKVSLVFETGGRRYLVERTPTQQTTKKRGEGVTTRRTTAYFAELTPTHEVVAGTAITDVDGVKRRVQQLLGLTEDQFRQVVVLPQGEFRKFLDAKHDERQAILSTLFQADRFSRIEHALKQRRSAADKSRTETKTRLDELLRGLGLADVGALAPAVAAADAAARAADARAHTAGAAQAAAASALEEANAVERLFAEWERARAEVAAVGRDRPAHDGRVRELEAARRAMHVQSAAAAHEGARTRLAAAQSTRDARTAALNNAVTEDTQATAELASAQAAANEESDALNASIAELRLALPRFQQYSAAVTKARADDTAAARAESEAGTADAAVTASATREQALQAQRATLRESAARGDGLRALRDTLAARDRARAQKTRHEQQLTSAREAAGRADAALQQARAAQACAEKAEEDAMRAALAHQAHAIATTLTPGAPCPVCGSTTHPAPASAVEDGAASLAAKREAVARARASVAEATVADQTARDAVTRLQALIEGLVAAAGADDTRLVASVEQELRAVEAAAVELKSLDEEYATLQERRPAQLERATQARATATAARADATRSAEAVRVLRAGLPAGHDDEQAVKTALDTAQHRLKVLQNAVTEARARSQRTAESVATARGALASAEEALKTANEDDAASSAALAKALADHAFSTFDVYCAARRTAEALRTLEQQTTAFEERRISADAALKSAAARCEGRARPDLHALTAARDAAAAAASAARADAGATQKAADDLRGAQARGEELATELLARDELLGRLDRLSSAADGRNPKRLGLQTYYLTSLFDEVIAGASARLERMSHGRYRLKRSDEVVTQRDYAGLELVVTDTFADGTRAVRTLSGGEAFLASLSLALGLSDAVLAQSGSRSLDTLFIDEGFGSLDADTLDVAMATLDALRGEGDGAGRSVGLISHIEEVKRVIDKRIVVTRRTGEAVSTVEVFA